jgi:hypothetical protein
VEFGTFFNLYFFRGDSCFTQFEHAKETLGRIHMCSMALHLYFNSGYMKLSELKVTYILFTLRMLKTEVFQNQVNMI